MVELFLLHDGRLLVNELAPRPHNTFHATEVACDTSQFEQVVRAMCDLPLGDDRGRPPGGDRQPARRPLVAGSRRTSTAALALPGVRLHLYGKRRRAPGRKMGHLSGSGADYPHALAHTLDAYDALGGAPADREPVRPRSTEGGSTTGGSTTGGLR